MTGRWRISTCDHRKEMVFDRTEENDHTEHGAWRSHTNSLTRGFFFSFARTATQNRWVWRSIVWQWAVGKRYELNGKSAHCASTNQAINSYKLDHYMDFGAVCPMDALEDRKTLHINWVHLVVTMIVYSERPWCAWCDGMCVFQWKRNKNAQSFTVFTDIWNGERRYGTELRMNSFYFIESWQEWRQKIQEKKFN